MAQESDVATMERYDFTSDWFGGHIPTWTRLFAGVAGRPTLAFLEVGWYEGG